MDKHLNEKLLAQRTGMSHRTLQAWRRRGEGPAYLKLGGRVVYRVEDVKDWEEQRLKRPCASEK